MVSINKLSNKLHLQLIGRLPRDVHPYERKLQQDKLRPFGLEASIDNSTTVNLPVPELGTYKEVIRKATADLGAPLISRLNEYASGDYLPCGFTLPPARPGWFQRSANVPGKWQSIPQPPDGIVITLDFETVNIPIERLVPWEDGDSSQWFPVCCVGITATDIYVWQWNPDNLVSTVPFGRNCVVVGHNVPYDRQFLAPEYLRTPSGNYFADTMAMWIPVRGMGNQQRIVFKMSESDPFAPMWSDETATNGLDAIYSFYFDQKLDKGVRDELIKYGYDYCRQEFSSVLQYCYKDVIATYQVFQKVYEENKIHRPSPTTQTAQLLMGSYWCPLSTTRYPSYYRDVETATQAIREQLDAVVDNRVHEVYVMYNESFQDYLSQFGKQLNKGNVEAIVKGWCELLARESPQLAQLDWTPALTGKTKGQPVWYRNHRAKPYHMATRVTPLLLNVTWRDRAVLWCDELGYYTLDDQGQREALPHPEDRGQRVTQLFIKGFSVPVEEGMLSAPGDLKTAIKAMNSLVNWTSIRKRVKALHVECPEGYPVTLFQITVTGTITGRCADNFSQVMPNPKAKRWGTGVKTLVEAPEGYVIIGGDISSQELTVAAWLADQVKLDYRQTLPFIGASPLSVSVMCGTSSTKTDVHSIMAAKQGMKRSDVKPEVYGGLYGQRVKGCREYLMKVMPTWSEEYCNEMAIKFTDNFVGKQDGRGGFTGGLASEAFTAIEKITKESGQPTPVLRCKVTKALEDVGRNFKTTMVNRIVQASGADWRDILVVLTSYFFKYYGIDGRLMLTIHDEIRAVVNKEHVLQAAYALNLAHVMTTCAFIDRLNLDLIPSSKAWFEEIDVTQHLSKTAKSDDGKPFCQCPEFPQGLPEGIVITATDLMAAIESGEVTV